MSRTASTLSSFIADAPPGEVYTIRNGVVELVEGNPALIEGIARDLAEYNTHQFSIAKGTTTVLTPFNQENGRYVDPIKGESFVYDHINQNVQDVQPYTSPVNIRELVSAVESYVVEHYPSESGFGVYPQSNGDTVVAIVDSRYSPSNFWCGRWKSWYTVEQHSQNVKGFIEIDIHYYEDGNVRLKTQKEINVSLADSRPATLVKEIAKLEDSYQDHLNKAFLGLNEGPFKALRRQLPVTRSKMTWGKAVGNYRLGKDIAGARDDS